MEKIATIYTDFKEKFGIPRQSGLIKSAKGKVVFEKPYRAKEAVRGLEDFSHIWLIWGFSKNVYNEFSPTVRPPLLGGNKRMGVFATRSSFRPNGLGLSLVKLEKIEFTKDFGAVLYVSGVDMLDQTPIYDVKPYLPYADTAEGASGGFTDNLDERKLSVEIETDILQKIPLKLRDEIIEILSLDPRPSYIDDERTYGMKYSDLEIKFTVSGGCLKVLSVENTQKI